MERCPADFCVVKTFTNTFGCYPFNDQAGGVVYNDSKSTCYVRGEAPSVVDCTVTANYNSQLTACGGSLPFNSFNKQNLLECLPNAVSISFDSKSFKKKSRPGGDFFYNHEEKTFMNGL